MRRERKNLMAGGEADFDLGRAEGFMRRAIELGRAGVEAGDGGPFGAVVVRAGEIIAEGWNRVVAENDPTAHGEVRAIRAAGRELKSFRLEGCELYTSGEPCPMCLGACYWARLDRVFYGFGVGEAAQAGFDDGFIYEELGRPRGERRLRLIQVLGKEAGEELKRYAGKAKRVAY